MNEIFVGSLRLWCEKTPQILYLPEKLLVMLFHLEWNCCMTAALTWTPVRSNRTANPVWSVFANATQLRELSGRDPWEEQGSVASLHPAVFCFSWSLKSARMRLTAAAFRQSGLRNKRLNSGRRVFNLLGPGPVSPPAPFIHSSLLPAVYTVNGLKL